LISHHQIFHQKCQSTPTKHDCHDGRAVLFAVAELLVRSAGWVHRNRGEELFVCVFVLCVDSLAQNITATRKDLQSCVGIRTTPSGQWRYWGGGPPRVTPSRGW